MNNPVCLSLQIGHKFTRKVKTIFSVHNIKAQGKQKYSSINFY
jgi:hypothetical protein